MKAKDERIQGLNEEIRLTKANIRLLKKARKSCTCGTMLENVERQKPHYHVLIHYDSESGDEYLETSAAKHRRFTERLIRSLARLESRLAKIKSKK